MKWFEIVGLLDEYTPKVEKGYILYCKVYLNDINLTIDLNKSDELTLSSNDFLTIGKTTFYNIGAIKDIEFY